MIKTIPDFWSRDIVETLRLAWPIALTQLGQIAMLTTDLLMIGRLGDRALGAASLGHTVFFCVFVIGMGLVSAVAPLAAQGVGAGEPTQVRRALRMGLWVAVGLGLVLSIAQLWGAEILIWLGQDPDTARQAGRYLQGLAWCLVPGWGFIALRGVMGALNRPEPALWLTLAAVPLNALLAYGLIYGAFGLPQLDLLGAGIATTLVNTAMCAASVAVIMLCQPFKPYRALARWWRYDAVMMRQMLRVGVPIAGAFMLEFGLFGTAALMMGWISPSALAAHQIALQTAAIAFMVPFGISMAATVRVGHAVGRGNAADARRAGLSALAIGGGFMAVTGLLIIAARSLIPGLFLGAASVDALETVRIANLLLLFAAGFAITDGVQTIAAGALRGLNDTKVPMLCAGLSFWVIGVGSAYLLGVRYGFGAAGIWSGISMGLAVFAVLLTARFHVLTRGGRLPSAAVVTRT